MRTALAIFMLSLSAQALCLEPQAFEECVVSKVVDLPVDWKDGTTYYYIGKKKNPEQTREAFYRELANHTIIVSRAFVPQGLLKYYVIMKGDYEYALGQWVSVKAVEGVNEDPRSKPVFEDGDELLTGIHWAPASEENLAEFWRLSKGCNETHISHIKG